MHCVSFPLLHPVDSRLRGNDGEGTTGNGGMGDCLVVTPPCGYCLEASMTGPDCPTA